MAHRSDSLRGPIALIGIGCRLPGGIAGPRSLWAGLANGLDAISEIPADRWDVERYYAPDWQQPGRINARHGGFLDEVDGFDASFFGISGRVAEQMDPQQRLLLEVSWEAFEDAGIVPASLAGGRTGVFVGGCSHDYAAIRTSPGEAEGLGPHSATGLYMSLLSNRLSYSFDLRGPSMTVDTACSSSLVAVHLACESLHRGESDLAVAAGVNVILAPEAMTTLSQASMLSPDGYSRAFDASANGYARGEGVGVVVLKPLEQALRDQDRIYALIRGTAVNQDGRTRGITVPSGEAQEVNFRAALASAGIAPREVGYVEAHGTGTPVGDPIEAHALGRVLTEGREPGRTVLLGSIKTNLGHLEGGAGVAGLIKAALSVHHRQIPASRLFEIPNPEIDFRGLQLEVPTTTRPWPEAYEVAVASVNSFGFGGTNANVVLTEPLPAGQQPLTGSAPATPTVLTLSARSRPALDRLALSLSDDLAATEPSLEAVAGQLALRRSHFAHRLAVTARTAGEAATELRRFADEAASRNIVTGMAQGERGKLAFVFNGQGPQWHAMARTLLRSSPVFRSKVAECDKLARQFVDWSILDELSAEDERSSGIDRTEILQPTMFAVQVGLADLWQSLGIVPDGVVGHSMGEIAAACVAGTLDLSSALRVICRRARIQQDADASGGMLYVAVDRDKALSMCARHPEGLWLAAENSPHACTLSGRREFLQPLGDELREAGVFARNLRVNCACHSPDMDPLRERLLQGLGEVTADGAGIPFYSTVTAGLVAGEDLGAEYWWRNFREPVLFAPTIRAMAADGFDTFVELSPHPVVGHSIKETMAEAGREAMCVGSLNRERDDWECLLAGFAELYTSGVKVHWERRFPDGVAAMDLPTNPWMHESFWDESEVSRRARTGVQAHPMLRRTDAVRPTWEIKWDDHRLGWVKQHDVLGSIIVPGAAYLEAALAAGRELTGGPCALEFIEFERACVLPPDEPQLSRIELDPDEGTFTVHCRPVRGSTWVRNAHGRFHMSQPDAGPRQSFDLDAIRGRCTVAHDATQVYAPLRAEGYDYGPAFCGIEELLVGERESLARVDVPRVLRDRAGEYLFHPALLDACLQSVILPSTQGRTGDLQIIRALPVGVGKARLTGEITFPLWCYTNRRTQEGNDLTADVFVLDKHGQTVAEFTDLRVKGVRQAGGAAGDPADEFHRLEWQLDRATAETTRIGRRSCLTTTPSDILPQLLVAARELSGRLERQAYTVDYLQGVHRLCAAYIARCLQEFGVVFREGSEFRPEDFIALLPDYTRALAGLVGFLVEDGILTAHQGWYRVDRVVGLDADGQWAGLVAQHPSCLAELRLLRHAGRRLHEVLTGSIDPLEVLFPDGSPDDVAPIYENSPAARLYNGLVTRTVEQFVQAADPHRTLRVLEVGGGTGGLTAGVLPVLPPDRCEYVFTDLSAAFTEAGRRRFGRYPFLQCQTLDLEADPDRTGLVTGTFDLVLASDVLHATTDLKKTLLHLKDLLAPGGVLILTEAAPGSRWLELTFGLTKGWWLFRDFRLRPDGPLLPSAQWITTLRSAGYEDVAAVGDPGHAGPGSQTVVLGRAPDSATSRPARDPGPAGHWVILGESSELSSELGVELVQQIEATGGRADLTPLVEDRADEGGEDGTVCLRRPAEFDRLLASHQASHQLQGIIQLCNVATSDAALDAAAVERAARHTLLANARIFGALNNRASSDWPQVFLVTRGAHALRNDTVRLEAAAAWGLALVAGLELPLARCKVIDLDARPSTGEGAILWDELRRDDREKEIALRAGERFVRRMVALSSADLSEPIDSHDLRGECGFALDLPTPGVFDDLRYLEVTRAAPEPGQVEVEVRSAGLNFLDVLTGLGQVPLLKSASDYRFGAECSGVVRRVGPGVTAFQPGDEVVAVSSAQGAVASHITLDETFVVPKPAGLSFEDAASIPIAFLTAWFALNRLAHLEPGERVLVHSAAGGTGLAALQIAQMAGAEVFATAGSPVKRELLHALGVRHVMDSRSLTFAEEVLAATGGRGVDVVLSATTGAATSRSIACLAPYGRYVDIGKRDILSDRRLGLRPFLRNLSYFSFDLRQLMVDRPRQVRAELDALMDLFAKGTLRPLPHRIFHPAEPETALRTLQAGKHIGKVLLAMDAGRVRVTPARRANIPSPEGTWLITGGLGGIGLAMAEALADAGLRHLALVGRSGVPDVETQQRLDSLSARGVDVRAERVDVSSREAVAELLRRLAHELPPLRGILHCAMVLDDALLTDLDETGVARVLAPKVLGALHLHDLTAHLPLDAFVLFSSATSITGNPGQASYAAANAVLDHLAEARRASGQPALAVNWGAVSDVGFVARHGKVAQQLRQTGMRGLTSKQAYEALRTLLNSSSSRVAVLGMDWPQFFRHRGFNATTEPRYTQMYPTHTGPGPNPADRGPGTSFLEQLRSCSDDDRTVLLTSRLRTRLATLLGIPLEELDDTMPLTNYIDSLLSVELSAWIDRELGLKVTIMDLMRGRSVLELSADLLCRLPGASSPEAQ